LYAEETWSKMALSLVNPVGLVRYVYRTAVRVARVAWGFQYIEMPDIVSGVVLGVIMAAFGVVNATTMLEEVGLEQFLGLASAVQAVAIVVGGMLHVFFADVGVSIASPVRVSPPLRRTGPD